MSEEVGKADGLNLAGVEQYNKAADAVQALLTNKIDAVCIDDQVAKNFVAANEDKLTMLDTAYKEESYAIAVSKDNPELTEALNGAIAELKEDGTLDAHPEQVHCQGGGRHRLRQPRGHRVPQRHPGHGHQRRFRPLTSTLRTARSWASTPSSPRPCAISWATTSRSRTWSSTPSSRLWVSGKADFGMAGMTVTPEREEQIDFTDTYCTAAQNVIVLK